MEAYEIKLQSIRKAAENFNRAWFLKTALDGKLAHPRILKRLDEEVALRAKEVATFLPGANKIDTYIQSSSVLFDLK